MRSTTTLGKNNHSLHAAAQSGDIVDVVRLLSAGEDSDIATYWEGLLVTPLHVAVFFCSAEYQVALEKHLPVIQLLLEGGADVHRAERTWGTPLHIAAISGNIHVAELLLRYGADVNSKEEAQHKTPLHCAVSKQRLRVVDFLVSNGADLDAVADAKPNANYPMYWDAAGLTPLHIAAREGYLGIAETLVAAGASKGIRAIGTDRRSSGETFEGLTAMDVALLSRLQEARINREVGAGEIKLRQVDWDKLLAILGKGGHTI